MSGNTQVLRFETKAKLQAQLVKHVAGETRPETARDSTVVSVHGEGQRLPAILNLGGVGLTAARQRLDEVRPPRRKGKGGRSGGRP